MAIKYEKVNTNNIRKWEKSDTLLNKQDLQTLRADWNFIANMADVQLEKFQVMGLFQTPATIKAAAQAKVDGIDALLDLFNNTTTQENIDFIDE